MPRFGPLAILSLVALLVSAFVLVTGAVAKPAVNTIGSPGIAIKGYDPVAYFEQGGPRAGSSKHTVKHAGVRWQFSSAANKAKFEQNPARYMPAYGGYCAYGVAQGYLVKIEPDAWAIRNGKLYLNYNRNVQRTWSKSPDAYIQKANVRWPKLVKSR